MQTPTRMPGGAIVPYRQPMQNQQAGGSGGGFRLAGLDLLGALRPEALKGLLRNPRVIAGGAGLAGLAALFSAASEFGDANETNTQNMVDAGGNLAGTVTGGAIGGLLGAPLGPVGSLALGSLGAALGGQAGKGVTRGVSDAIFAPADPRDRELAYADKAADLARGNRVEDMQAFLPIETDMMRARTNDLIAQQNAQSRLVMDQNYQNALLTQLLNSSAQYAAGRNSSLAQTLGI